MSDDPKTKPPGPGITEHGTETAYGHTHFADATDAVSIDGHLNTMLDALVADWRTSNRLRDPAVPDDELRLGVMALVASRIFERIVTSDAINIAGGVSAQNAQFILCYMSNRQGRPHNHEGAAGAANSDGETKH